MFREYMKIRLTAFLAVLIVPGAVIAANGVCLSPLEATDAELENNGFAVMVQIDQGNGSIDCSSFIGLADDGVTPEPMHQVDDIILGNQKGTEENPIYWTSSDPELPATNIDNMYISNNDGSRCLQIYSGNAVAGWAGAGTRNKPSTIVACADSYTEPVPPPPPTLPTPPQITGKDCPKPFQDAIDMTDQWDVLTVFGGSGVNEGGSIVCVDQTLNQPAGGNLLAAADPLLNRCVNRCITPDATTTTIDWFPLNDSTNRGDGGVCEGPGDAFGRYPIECRVCELTEVVDSDFFEPDLPFCWRQGQDVQPNEPATSDSTMKPPPPDQGNQAWTVNGKFGSTCYLISGRTRSGYPYSYWAPSGCPN